MHSRAAVFVPATILAKGQWKPVSDDALRPSGRGLTGADLQLFYFLIDAAAEVKDGIVNVLQTSVTAILGRVDVKRMEASLDRLRGTDLYIGTKTIPCAIDYFRTGTGSERRMWHFQLDRRLLEMVRSAIDQKQTIALPVDELRKMSSRLSIGLYSRWMAWLQEVYPGKEVAKFGRRPGKRAIEVEVSVENLGHVFAYIDALRPSQVKRLLVTKSKTCPLKREFDDAGIMVDTIELRDEGYDRTRRLSIMMTALSAPGIAYVAAAERHAKAQLDNARIEKAAI